MPLPASHVKRMGRFVQLFLEYAVAVGVTSHRLVGGHFFQSWKTRIYVTIINGLTLTLLPVLYWLFMSAMAGMAWPRLLFLTSYVRHVVNYLTVVYTLFSRKSRDSALLDIVRILENVLHHLDRRQVNGNDEWERTLCYLFYAKFVTVVYMFMANFMNAFMLPFEVGWLAASAIFFFINAMNILYVARHMHHLTLWHATHGFYLVNHRLVEMLNQRLKCRGPAPSRQHIDELRQLRSIHAMLTRTTQHINQIYGLQMLTSRFDFAMTTVIDGYWGFLFAFRLGTPKFMVAYGFITFMMRCIDFYLIDTMCQTLVQNQHFPQHKTTECCWFKELNDFLIYGNCSKLRLWVCGLFTVDHRSWFAMLKSIFAHFILLMQFHMVYRKDEKS